MTTPLWKDSNAYKTYSSFASRPNNTPTWPKNAAGKYVIEAGELMCRYEVDGAICPNTTRFRTRQELGKHLKYFHEADMTTKMIGGLKDKRGGIRQAYLDAYYTNLIRIMRSAPADSGADNDAPTAENVPDNAAEAEDSHTEDEDNVDDADAIPSTPAHNHELPIISHKVSSLSFTNTLMHPEPPKPSNSPPSRLPKSYRNTSLYSDWDEKDLKAAREEDNKIIRKATSNSKDRSLAERVMETQGNYRRF